MIKNVARGGFAIRAGHAQHGQLAGRIAVKSCREVRQRLPGMLHADVGDGQPVERLLTNDSHRAFGDGLRDIFVPIRRTAGGRDKKRTGLNLAGIGRDGLDQRVLAVMI